MDAVERVTKVERPCAERIAWTACHEPRQIRLAVNHFCGRMPIRPFDHASNALRAGPSETLAADANTIAQSPAMAQNQVKVCIGRVDNDGASRFGRLIIYELALELWRKPLGIRFRLIFRGERVIVGVGFGRSGYLPFIALLRSWDCRVWPWQRWLSINRDVLRSSGVDQSGHAED